MDEDLTTLLIKSYIGNEKAKRILEEKNRDLLLYKYFVSTFNQAKDEAKQIGLASFNSNEFFFFEVQGVINTFLDKLDLKPKYKSLILKSKDKNSGDFEYYDSLEDKSKLVSQITKGIIDYLIDVPIDLFQKPNRKFITEQDAHDYNQSKDYDTLLKFQKDHNNEGLLVLYRFKFETNKNNPLYSGGLFGIQPNEDNPLYRHAIHALKPLVLNTITGFAEGFVSHFKDLPSDQIAYFNQILFFLAEEYKPSLNPVVGSVIKKFDFETPFGKKEKPLSSVVDLYYRAIKNL
jgi:hypothetical protein